MGKNKLYRYSFDEQTDIKTPVSVMEREVFEICSLHWHNYIELELFVEGQGYQIFNGERLEVKKGTLVVVRLTDFHEVIPTDGLKLLHVMVDDRILSQETLNRLAASPVIFRDLNENENSTMLRLFRLCMEENEREKPNREYLKNLLNCIFIQIFRLIPHSKPTVFAQSMPIQEAVLFMHMHFRENPTLEETARIAHYNPCHFSATFHREMGKTYCEYLNKLKIDYAKELILTADLKISDIGFECGFTSHSNFLRLFKEETGMSPIQYRNVHSK